MPKIPFKTLVLEIFLAVLLLFGAITPVQSAATYTPGVRTGQWAKYKVLQDDCTLTATLCQLLGTTSLQNSNYALIQISSVVGTKIEFTLISVYENGTSSRDAVSADVLAGTINATNFEVSGNSNYFVLAANLTKGDAIWGAGAPKTPTLNSTRIETVVGGTAREVNFLNMTTSRSLFGSTISGKSDFAYDKISGLFVEISISQTASGTVHGDFDLRLTMVDNDIWLNSSPPDYSLNANPTSLTIVGSATGSAEITPTRSSQFSATISLREVPSSGSLTCSLSRSSLVNGTSDSSILSCAGSPGSYTVTVEGNGSYTIRTITIAVSVAAGPVSPQSASPLLIPIISGVVVSGLAAVLLALLLIRRRSKV